MALARIERVRGTKEKRLERVLSEGKKNDGGVKVLRVGWVLICILET